MFPTQSVVKTTSVPPLYYFDFFLDQIFGYKILISEKRLLKAINDMCCKKYKILITWGDCNYYKQ